MNVCKLHHYMLYMQSDKNTNALLTFQIIFAIVVQLAGFKRWPEEINKLHTCKSLRVFHMELCMLLLWFSLDSPASPHAAKICIEIELELLTGHMCLCVRGSECEWF